MQRYGLARSLRVAAVVSLGFGLVPLFGAPMRPAIAREPDVPAGFTDDLLAQVEAPTALAFPPDGRMLVTDKLGLLLSLPLSGDGDPIVVLDLTASICADFERGLLGVAVDPDFATNHFVYVYYTFKKHGGCERDTAATPVNRVARFTIEDERALPASEVVLIDNIPSIHGNHNAGDLQFGNDGYLYVSVGDGGCDWDLDDPARGCAGENNASRDMHVLSGKLLRITSDGDVPASNPYAATGDRCALTGRTDPGRQCQETFVSGLRNPFRIAIDRSPGASRVYINNVGQDTWETVAAGIAGADYGWNIREGFCLQGSLTECAPDPRFQEPIFAYSHLSGCASVTGGAFVPNGAWPAEFEGSYLFGDYVCGTIFRLAADGAVSSFANDLGHVVSLAFGPGGDGAAEQALYYIRYAGHDRAGEIRRVSYGTTSRPSIAGARAEPAAGALPLTVHFVGGDATSLPDPSLTFEWDFGDGTPPVAAPTPSHTYRTAGTYTARLTVRDTSGGTDTATFRIDAGNTAPTAEILAPTTDYLFRVGEEITLRGQGRDAEDGALAEDALSWQVFLHHEAHTHPFLPPTPGGEATFTAPPPENLVASSTSYLEVILTATDANGLTQTVSRDLRPELVELTFTTTPPGLSLQIGGQTLAGPAVVTAWAGDRVAVGAASQPDAAGRFWTFTGWDDDDAATRYLTVPPVSQAFTATFRTASFHATPVADARVQRGAPTVNFGEEPTLQVVAGGAETWTYLTFDVNGVAGTVARVILWLYAEAGSEAGITIWAADDVGWREPDITWANRPSRSGDPISVPGPTPSGAWVAYDVTALVDGNGTYTLVLTGDATGKAVFSAAEVAARAPRLEIDVVVDDGTSISVPSAATATATTSAARSSSRRTAPSPTSRQPLASFTAHAPEEPPVEEEGEYSSSTWSETRGYGGVSNEKATRTSARTAAIRADAIGSGHCVRLVGGTANSRDVTARLFRF